MSAERAWSEPQEHLSLVLLELEQERALERQEPVPEPERPQACPQQVPQAERGRAQACFPWPGAAAQGLEPELAFLSWALQEQEQERLEPSASKDPRQVRWA